MQDKPGNIGGIVEGDCFTSSFKDPQSISTATCGCMAPINQKNDY